VRFSFFSSSDDKLFVHAGTAGIAHALSKFFPGLLGQIRVIHTNAIALVISPFLQVKDMHLASHFHLFVTVVKWPHGSALLALIAHKKRIIECVIEITWRVGGGSKGKSVGISRHI